MRAITLVLAVPGIVSAQSVMAQNAVTLYGLIDAGLMYTNNVAKGSASGPLIQATSGTINGSRWGLKGAETIGSGMKLIFVLENGFSVQTGKLAQDGREFGRQAFVGIASEQVGTITGGRQYDVLVDFVEPLAGSASTFGDAGFAHPFDNDNLDHSIRINNSVKYTSNAYAGFTVSGLYGFSNSVNFAMNRAFSFGVSYVHEHWHVAAAYLQMNGSAATTAASVGAVDVNESPANGIGGYQAGADLQRVFGAGIGYQVGALSLGFVYTHSSFHGTTSFGQSDVNGAGSMTFNNFDLNSKYALTPKLGFGVSYTYTDGHLGNEAATHYGVDPKWHQVNFQSVYSLSKRTDVYAEAMYQHVIGHNFVAFINTSGGAASTANQFVATLGMRARF